eukprot:TRINITY_DN17516_c0_g1_i1.p1 TRINITY_DN17516_c0_g1~~TRINITY_DN17516_c0_g1_i1.p1  ORF type:complete len:479 (-),score=101.42 TRINITY_DN17516_c0_g1_i1:71-1507(-)
MATGDLKRNLERALNALATTKYGKKVDLDGLKTGDPSALLPLLHFAIVEFSQPLSRFAYEKGYNLIAKTDKRFIEGAFKFLRDELGYRSTLNVLQFFSTGYAERKLMLLCDVIKLAVAKHELLRREMGRDAGTIGSARKRETPPTRSTRQTQSQPAPAPRSRVTKQVVSAKREEVKPQTGRPQQYQQLPHLQKFQQSQEDENDEDGGEPAPQQQPVPAAHPRPLREDNTCEFESVPPPSAPSQLRRMSDLELTARKKQPARKPAQRMSCDNNQYQMLEHTREQSMAKPTTPQDFYSLVEVVGNLEAKLDEALRGLSDRMHAIELKIENLQDVSYQPPPAHYPEVAPEEQLFADRQEPYFVDGGGVESGGDFPQPVEYFAEEPEGDYPFQKPPQAPPSDDDFPLAQDEEEQLPLQDDFAEGGDTAGWQESGADVGVDSDVGAYATPETFPMGAASAGMNAYGFRRAYPPSPYDDGGAYS